MKQHILLSIRVLVLLSAITWWLPRIATAQSAGQDVKNGAIEGTVYTIDPDGARSVVPGALVRLIGPSSSRQTVTNDQGKYSFVAVATNTYQIDVTTPGLNGSNTVSLASRTLLYVPA